VTTGLILGSRGGLPIIRQTEPAECGLACLAMIASAHGHKIDLNTLRRRHPVSLKGVTLRGLMHVASQLDLACRAVRFELEHLHQLRLPAIIHWDMNHFVVLKSVCKRGIVVHDPGIGERSLSIDAASKHLTGIALECSPTAGFASIDETARLPFSLFWKDMRGTGHAVLQIFALSLILEGFVVASPFYLQLAVDQVIARGDVDLLIVLALGFALLTAIKVSAGAIRSLVILAVQNLLHFQIGARLFRHLLRLPLAYFERRHIGDILSRFGSIEPIRNVLAEGMIAGAIDGLMALATLAMMCAYSVPLAAVVAVAFIFYVALRLALYRAFRQRSQATIEAKALENSHFVETVRAMQSLKLFNRENEREAQWLNRFADTVSANIRLGRVKVAFTTANDAIFGLENIITIYLAVRFALDHSMTVGMIFAFISYKQQFIDKGALMVEKALEFRVLDLHLERLGDIALSSPERNADQALTYSRPVRGRIELRNVFFRYSETEPFVLENINLRIEPGEFVTIMGPSGGGKTTIVKVMLGLLEPSSGDVLIDGLPLQTAGARAYREQVGAVMQEDQLLSGSIADNICFFDPAFDLERMIECARLSAVHDEIMAMPMTYNSLVGDMGSSLSGGQKQRILLARALYRRPKILILDEGTAHLDIENEQRINQALRGLDMTRISVAHRPEATTGADRIMWIGRPGTSEHGIWINAVAGQRLHAEIGAAHGRIIAQPGSVAGHADAADVEDHGAGRKR
jgi:ATP-binding cassette subfamily B protein RaxB